MVKRIFLCIFLFFLYCPVSFADKELDTNSDNIIDNDLLDPNLQILANSSLTNNKYYLSAYPTIADFKTALNDLNANCTGVIDQDITLVSSLVFDPEVTLQPTPGNVITAGAYNLTFYKRVMNSGAPFQWINENSSGIVSCLNKMPFYPQEWMVNTYPGTTDLTHAVQAAVNTGHCILTEIFGVSHVDVPSHSVIEAVNWDAGLFQLDSGAAIRAGGGADGILAINRANAATPIEDIVIKNLKLYANVIAVPHAGTQEHQHLILTGHTKDIVIDHVYFAGWVGDAVCLGSQGVAPVSGQVALNTTIRDCFFDGLTYNTRQAISGLSVDGLLIENNRITRTTEAGMPGAVALEPEIAAGYVRNITVKENKIYDIGPSGGTKKPCFIMDLGNMNDTYPERRNRISFTHNSVSNCAQPVFKSVGATNTAEEPQSIDISWNVFDTVSENFYLAPVNTVSIEGNSFLNCGGMVIGAATYLAKNVKVESNMFDASGNPGAAINFSYLDDVEILNNTFSDCGVDAGAGVNAMYLGASTASNFRIHDNTFKTPNTITGRTFYNNGGTLDSDCRFYDNTIEDGILMPYGWNGRVERYYLSEFVTIKAAETFLNGLNADCELELNKDETLSASTGNVSFDPEVTLQPTPGNVITLGAYNLTGVKFAQDIGDFQVFNENGAGVVTFSSCPPTGVSAMWWGAAGDGTADDSDELNSACASVKAIHGQVRVSADIEHKITSQVDYSEVALIGMHRGDEDSKGSKIWVSGGITGLYATGVKSRLENLNIWGDETYTGNLTGIDASSIGVYLYEGHEPKAKNCSFHRLETAIKVGGSAGTYDAYIQENRFQFNSTNILVTGGAAGIPPNGIKILYNTMVNGGTGTAIKLLGNSTHSFLYGQIVGNRFENFTTVFDVTLISQCQFLSNEIETFTNLFSFATSQEVDAIDCTWLSGGGVYPSLQLGSLPSAFNTTGLKLRGYNHSGNLADIETDSTLTFLDYNNSTETGLVTIGDADFLSLTSNYILWRFLSGQGIIFTSSDAETFRITKAGVLSFSATPQSLTGAGTINATTAITNFTADGVANALIISDGVTQGQLKTVCMIGGEGAGNSGSLTGANIEGTSIVFTANGHRADLVWTNSKWFFSGSATYTP